MGITQHAYGSDNVRALLNVALARGNVGRPGAGLMPIRGHSGVQGGAEMGAYATAFPGNVPISPESAAGAGGAVRLPGPRRPRAHGRGDDRGGRARRARRALRQRRQLPRRAARLPAGRRAPRRACPCACTRTSSSRARCWSTRPPAGRWCCCRRRPATSSPAAAPRPPPSGASPSARRSRARGPARPAPSGRSTSSSPGGWTRSGPAWWASPTPRRSARRSRGSCPSTTASSTCGATGDQVQWGGPRLCEGWVFPTPDGRAHFHDVAPRDPRPPAGALPAVVAARQAVQLHGVRRPATRSPGAGRDALFISRRGRGGAGRGRGRAHPGALGHRRGAGPRPPRARCGRATCRCSGPSATPVIEAGVRDPDSFVPDYNAVVELIPR